MKYVVSHVPNITLSLPETLYRKMKRHPEFRWSELARRAIAEHLNRVEGSPEAEIGMRELDDVVRNSGVNLDKITWDKAIKHYEKMRELEWKRTYSIRARS